MADLDVVIVGAGSAGIAAGRALAAAKLAFRIVEARPRVGGRAWTVSLRGHAIDLGAHWLHSGHRNPLVSLGFQRGEPLRPAPFDRVTFQGGKPLDDMRARRAGAGWERVVQALTVAARRPGPDRDAFTDLPLLGPTRRRTLAIHGLVCGRPLDEVSLRDFAAAQDEDDANWFIAGGYGAYIARLARGLPIALGAPVRRITHGERTIRVTTDAGDLTCRAVLVTAPMMVLQQGAISFAPALPAKLAEAIAAFLPGTYEHAVLHWPGAPFRKPDRLGGFVGGRFEGFGMLTRIDGSAFHYFELDHPTVNRLCPSGAAQLARQAMRTAFGARAISDLTVQRVTDWRHDPWARGSWSVVPAGHHGLREALRAPTGRVWFAGEATSPAQWGTVGGAWEEGERAAVAIVAALGR